MAEATSKKLHKQQKAVVLQPPKQEPHTDAGAIVGGAFAVVLILVWFVGVPVAFVYGLVRFYRWRRRRAGQLWQEGVLRANQRFAGKYGSVPPHTP